MKWEIKNFKKVSVSNFYLIEGLPGMGNVGKICVDFMIDELKAEKVIEIYSDSFPHCVFVNENNLIELPSIKIYQKKAGKHSFLFIAGDIQPLDEASCYEFCNLLLDIFEKHKGKEIITIGGIGQHQIPKNPKIYCTGNNKSTIKEYTSIKNVNSKIYGVVGPIIGVSGLLLGIASQRKINAITLLSETYGNPTYLGLKGAKGILKIVRAKFSLTIKIENVGAEVEEIERAIKKGMDIIKLKQKKSKDINYIG